MTTATAQHAHVIVAPALAARATRFDRTLLRAASAIDSFVVARLEQLVVRGRGTVYGQGSRRGTLWAFLSHGYWRRLAERYDRRRIRRVGQNHDRRRRAGFGDGRDDRRVDGYVLAERDDRRGRAGRLQRLDGGSACFQGAERREEKDYALNTHDRQPHCRANPATPVVYGGLPGKVAF